jgi:hypothetical protein
MALALALATALIVVAPSTGTPPSTPTAPDARSRFDAARAAFLAGDLSGAARGFDEVARDPAASPGLSEAARVLAETCREMSRRGLVLREPLTGERGAPARVDRSGRGELVWFSTLYGIFVADGLGAVAEVDDGKVYLGLTLAGGGAGLALSLAATRTGPMSRGRAAAIQAATVWTSVNAATICAIADTDGKTALGATIASGLVALGATAAATRGRAPSEGDVSLVSSGGFWGLAAGALSLTFLDDPSGPTVGWILLGGTDAGLLAGWALASANDLSRSRVLVIDAAGVLGGLAGVLVPVLASSDSPETYGVASLAGIAGGLVLGTILTRDWDREEVAPRASIAAPFANRLADGTVLAGLTGRF